MTARDGSRVASALALESVSCNLCGANNDRLILEKGGYRIVRCSACGLVYVNPRPARAQIERQYDAYYFRGGSYADYQVEQQGYERTFERRLRSIERIAPPGRILDLGSAFGYFLRVALGRGWDAHGLDISSAACAYAVGELGLRVTCGRIEEADYPNCFFDVVTLNDSFEHLTDPLGALRHLWRVLRPGGHLFLVTQDSGRLLVRLLGSRWPQYKPEEHLYYFTGHTLRQMLSKAGFRVLWIRDEVLVCTLAFLAEKVGELCRPAGRVATRIIDRFGWRRLLVPVRTGYEVMLCAQKPL